MGKKQRASRRRHTSNVLAGARFSVPIGALLSIAAAAIVAGCTSPGLEGFSTPVAPAPSVQADQIVGRWGLASYYNEADRPRIETAARDQCKQPYLINKGQAGGVIMHLADKREPEELRMKGASGGKTFIGPEGDAGGEFDREVMSFNNNVLVLRWVDSEVASRYGTMVYVRCDGTIRTTPNAPIRPAPKR